MGTPILGDILSVILSHKLLAWLLLLGLLSTDSFIAGSLNFAGISFSGIAGSIFSWALTPFGLNLPIQSWQLTFLLAIFPIVIFCLKKQA